MHLSLIALRFRLQTPRPLAVPDAKYANVVRGALGQCFRDMSCLPECAESSQCPGARQCQYARLFEADINQHQSPGGMADAPRPFVLRVQPAANGLTVGLYLFGPPGELVPPFTEAVLRMCADGLGPGRVRASLAEAVAINGQGSHVPLDLHGSQIPEPILLPLAPDPAAPPRIRVRFLTPTELKYMGGLARHADFPALFGRVRDRVLFLATHYGNEAATDHGPLARLLGDQAAQIRRIDEQLEFVESERLSSRTGQRHSLGGFIGQAGYEGDFRLLWPWLLAAQWTGVGRQTVWGKGQIQCEPA